MVNTKNVDGVDSEYSIKKDPQTQLETTIKEVPTSLKESKGNDGKTDAIVAEKNRNEENQFPKGQVHLGKGKREMRKRFHLKADKGEMTIDRANQRSQTSGTGCNSKTRGSPNRWKI